MQTLHSNALSPEQLRWPEHMARALAIAGSVLTAAPNPRVGCVLVADLAGPNDEQIAEGWHKGAGLPHAEPEALAQVQGEAKGATAFVTLEPCCHTGRTGPCSTALIAAGIQQLVIASRDPNPKVSGGGIAELEAAGVAVFFLAEFEAEARALNRGFFSRMERGRPFVRCKLAMSLDGRTALANGESQWITGADARADVQRLRAESDAIVTGIGTVLADNPALTVRPESLPLDENALALTQPSLVKQPLRVVLDSRGRLSPSAKIVTEGGHCVVYSLADADTQLPTDAGSGFERRLLETLETKDAAAVTRVDLASVLDSLALQDQCNELLVEAGATLSTAFLEAGLVDELIVYIAPKLMGSDAQPLLTLQGLTQMSQLTEYKIKSSQQIGNDLRLVVDCTPRS